ncbi:MAG: hypothetical protein ACI9YP_001060, partial [Colwellia sp.]
KSVFYLRYYLTRFWQIRPSGTAPTLYRGKPLVVNFPDKSLRRFKRRSVLAQPFYSPS